MARGPRYAVPYRRRREGKTNYRKRLSLLKSRMTRAVVRLSLMQITIQFVKYHPEGDRVVTSAVSKELRSHGWNHSLSNTSAAYLTGYIAAKKALKNGIERAILDIGMHRPVKGSRVFAALKGMLDAGIDIPHSQEVIPSWARITSIDGTEERRRAFEATFDTVKRVYGAPAKEHEEESRDE